MQHNLVERKLNIECFDILNYKQIFQKISRKNGQNVHCVWHYRCKTVVIVRRTSV